MKKLNFYILHKYQLDKIIPNKQNGHFS